MLAVAEREFLRRGFNGASVDSIAEEAGYSKGAVYSHFRSKDNLFLAVMGVLFEERAERYAAVVLDHDRLEDSYRDLARFMVDGFEREPGWALLLHEFWTNVGRTRDKRTAALERRERYLVLLADVLSDLATKHDVRFSIPTLEVVRGSAALARGLALERVLSSANGSTATLEEMQIAYLRGLTRAAMTVPEA